MSENEPTYQEKLLILLAEELYAIRFLLTYPDRDGLELGGIPADVVVEQQARDLEKFRGDLGL